MVHSDMRHLSDYKVGDVLEIVRRFAGKDTTYKVDVINVDFHGNGLVTYSGLELGSGAFNPSSIGTAMRFMHIVSVKKVGHNPTYQYLGIKRTPENLRHYGVG